ncbi:MAG: hypothetical protein GX868_08825 [Actinobacteria bacterium]|nr:hypothetical protein [Actinomycetota bacterium]
MSLNLDNSEWQRVAFGDVVRNANETVKDAAALGIDRVVAMEHMDPGKLAIARWGEVANGTTFTRRVRPGQTLFGKRRAYQRKVAFAEFDAICSGDIYTFEADETQLRGEFLPFLVQSDAFFDHALDTSAGSLSPRTHWRDLANFQFNLPPLDEQKRIADLMWTIGHHHDSLAAMPREIEVAYDDWLKSRTEGLPTRPLADVLELQHGRPVPSALYGKGNFPLLRPGDMNADGSVAWSDSSVRIPQQFVDQHQNWVLDSGDLVINMTAQSLEDRFLGRVCRMHDRALLNQRIGRLTMKDHITTDFAFVALHSASFAEWVARRSEGSKVKHLHWRHIEDYPFPTPPADQQAVIVAESNAWSVGVQRLKTEASRLVALRSSVLAEVFGGI